jgi:hypothetical protein
LELEAIPSNLVFLSARPHIYKDISERVSYRLFKYLMHEGRLHAMPTLIPGVARSSIGAVLKAFCRRKDAWRNVGEQKYKSIVKFRRLYPKYSLVFFGDNGQGDLLAAEMALQADPPLISHAFISECQPRERCLSTLPPDLPEEERNARWEAMGVVWYRSPVEAAVQCARRGLLKDEALARVCESAVEDLEALAIRSPSFPHWNERFEELNRDLTEAQTIKEGIQLLDVDALTEELLAIQEAPYSGSKYSDQLSASLLDP